MMLRVFGLMLHPRRPRCLKRRARLRLRPLRCAPRWPSVWSRRWYVPFTLGPRRALLSLIARRCVLVLSGELQVGSIASRKDEVALLKRQIDAAEQSCAEKMKLLEDRLGDRHDAAMHKLTQEKDAEIAALQARVRILEGQISVM